MIIKKKLDYADRWCILLPVGAIERWSLLIYEDGGYTMRTEAIVDESVDELILCNEYEFDVEGRIA